MGGSFYHTMEVGSNPLAYKFSPSPKAETIVMIRNIIFVLSLIKWLIIIRINQMITNHSFEIIYNV